MSVPVLTFTKRTPTPSKHLALNAGEKLLELQRLWPRHAAVIERLVDDMLADARSDEGGEP